ncbi:MAG: LytR C-terminal domain-containing protein [Gemmatimonadetes bacterium]|nr:LytR C-terminal domain-containing protein [Gemmatimonadota bacterium]
MLIVAFGVALRTDFGAMNAPAWMRWATRGSPAAGAGAVERVVPIGTRIKVDVLNASDVRGAARTAVGLLRDAGFDVVYFGNTAERHDSTIVRDRSGHAEWADWVQLLLAPAKVETSPDSTRLVDLTVLIGALWRPPTESLRP